MPQHRTLMPHPQLACAFAQVFRNLRISDDEARRLAAIWHEWVAMRGALRVQRTAALTLLACLPPELGPPVTGAHHKAHTHSWARAPLGAHAGASANSVAALAALLRWQRAEAAAFARVECALLHSSGGLSATSLARLLLCRSASAPFAATDRLRLSRMAADRGRA